MLDSILIGLFVVICSGCQKDTPISDQDVLLSGQAKNSVKDIDGNVYKTVTIGNQVWMAENLKTNKYNDGTVIANVAPTDNSKWASLSSGAYSWFIEPSAPARYGGYYNWFAVGTGKLCPTGWHVPSDIEWTTFVTALGGVDKAGYKMKSKGGWRTYVGLTDPYGFSADGGGFREYDGNFLYNGEYGLWWSSKAVDSGNSTALVIYAEADWAHQNAIGKKVGGSVRCLKD